MSSDTGDMLRTPGCDNPAPLQAPAFAGLPTRGSHPRRAPQTGPGSAELPAPSSAAPGSPGPRTEGGLGEISPPQQSTHSCSRGRSPHRAPPGSEQSRGPARADCSRRRAPSAPRDATPPPAARLAAAAGSARPHWLEGGARAERFVYITRGEWEGRRPRSELHNAGGRAKGGARPIPAGRRVGGGRRGPEGAGAQAALVECSAPWGGKRDDQEAGAFATGIGRSSRQSRGGGTRAGLAGPHVRGGRSGGWG